MIGKCIFIASIATFIGVALAILFSEATRWNSNVGANLFFGLGLGAPFVYFLTSVVKRRWVEGGVAVGIGGISFAMLMAYVMAVWGRGLSGL